MFHHQKQVQKVLNSGAFIRVFSRNFLYNMTSFDAVVFHERNLQLKDLPSIRSLDQWFVHFNLEAPYWSTIHGISTFNNYFNLTMSYRLDADIHSSYGRFVPLQNITEDESVDDLIAKFASKNSHLANKPKLEEGENATVVVQFVSNCGSQSGREKVVQSLSQFMNVDVFGLCGNMTCDRTDKR